MILLEWKDQMSTNRIEELEQEVDRLKNLVEIYNKIFTHNLVPDKGYYYFICGEQGPKDSSGLPNKILVCPAYGCDWFQVYQDTGEVHGTEW